MTDEQHFVYDLISELRKDPVRQKAVIDGLKRIDSVTADVANGKASRSSITEAEAAMVPLCGFNFGLLIPRLFPRYPFENPLDLASRPFMFSMMSQAPGSVITLKAGRQVGKCVDGGTEVTTDSGQMKLRDIFDAGIPTG